MNSHYPVIRGVVRNPVVVRVPSSAPSEIRIGTRFDAGFLFVFPVRWIRDISMARAVHGMGIRSPYLTMPGFCE